MAIIKQSLPTPEVGWKRYDEMHPNIERIGNWTEGKSSSHYGESVFYSTELNASVRFTFFGTKLRILGVAGKIYSSNVSITIDGVEEIYSQYVNATDRLIALLYEKTDLPLGRHDVEIKLKDTNRITVDAIDIDDDGRLGTANKILIKKSDTSYVYFSQNPTTLEDEWISLGTSPTDEDWLNKGSDIITQAQLEKLSQQAITGRFAVKRL